MKALYRPPTIRPNQKNREQWRLMDLRTLNGNAEASGSGRGPQRGRAAVGFERARGKKEKRSQGRYKQQQGEQIDTTNSRTLAHGNISDEITPEL
jgi:hypothetical protein